MYVRTYVRMYVCMYINVCMVWYGMVWYGMLCKYVCMYDIDSHTDR